MNEFTPKLVIGAALFLTWVGFVLHPVQNSADIIDFCKNGLVGLGLYHVGTTRGAPAATNFPKT